MPGKNDNKNASTEVENTQAKWTQKLRKLVKPKKLQTGSQHKSLMCARTNLTASRFCPQWKADLRFLSWFPFLAFHSQIKHESRHFSTLKLNTLEKIERFSVLWTFSSGINRHKQWLGFIKTTNFVTTLTTPDTHIFPFRNYRNVKRFKSSVVLCISKYQTVAVIILKIIEHKRYCSFIKYLDTSVSLEHNYILQSNFAKHSRNVNETSVKIKKRFWWTYFVHSGQP